MNKRISNVSGINFEENSNDELFTKKLRCSSLDPLNFEQSLIKNIIGDLLSKPDINILEIGCGWGRNAQYFKNMKNVKYFSFDPSPTSLGLFSKQNFPKDRFYTSLDIDETILSQKYDLIFSMYVLQHIGYPDDRKLMSVDDIMEKISPCLKVETRSNVFSRITPRTE